VHQRSRFNLERVTARGVRSVLDPSTSCPTQVLCQIPDSTVSGSSIPHRFSITNTFLIGCEAETNTTLSACCAQVGSVPIYANSTYGCPYTNASSNGTSTNINPFPANNASLQTFFQCCSHHNETCSCTNPVSGGMRLWNRHGRVVGMITVLSVWIQVLLR
jgi:hypothetical protein